MTPDSEPSIFEVAQRIRTAAERRGHFSEFVGELASYARAQPVAPRALVATSLSPDPNSNAAGSDLSTHGEPAPMPSSRGSVNEDPVIGADNPLESLVRSVTSSPMEAPDNPIEAMVRSMNEATYGVPVVGSDPPPPSRFMVRVASPGRAHRATKRNYNYFEDLNAALATVEATRPTTPPG